MKNKTLREKIKKELEIWGQEKASEWLLDKILNLISKEIKKNRPKEKKEYYFERDVFGDKHKMTNPEDDGFNLALKEYDKSIADTLK